MLDHAFGTLGPAPRSRCPCSSSTSARSGPTGAAGSCIEGRARESIWRDGRWWDELAMSVLETDWRARRATNDAATTGPAVRRRRRSRRRQPSRDPRRRRIRPAATHDRSVAMTTSGPAADAARADVRDADRGQGPHGRQRPGRGRAARAAFADGDLERTPSMDQYLGDLDAGARAGRGPEARRQERRGGAVHPARHRPRARQRLRSSRGPMSTGREPQRNRSSSAANERSATSGGAPTHGNLGDLDGSSWRARVANCQAL